MTKARGEAPKPSSEPLTVPVVQAAVEPTMVPARALLALNPCWIRGEIIATFGSSAKTALCIAKNESGFQQYATHINTNGSIDRGIFQINSIHDGSFPARLAFNVSENIRYAHQLFQAQGWSPWVTKKACGV